MIFMRVLVGIKMNKFSEFQCATIGQMMIDEQVPNSFATACNRFAQE